ncbi:acyltransferase family protein [Colwellia sp. MSW7]|uniref:Acyltransferase family protein n=1 Tax=Colwellia maritima TaxID=2912588 RepID=A0ABS9WWH4_9GAMM|nr:acyltransferase family protein [Colwellia maritima]MCI2282220.1 acyltransferase family protein [Colwellia maritima]
MEFHFYLLLPLLFFIKNRWNSGLFLILIATLILRWGLHHEIGQIQTLSYWTIIGRLDQFILGMLAFEYRRYFVGRHLLIVFSSLLFAIFYWYFDNGGGFYMSPSYPSPDPLWIYLPTIEGLAYAIFIAWYDNSFSHSVGKFSRFIALIGTYSYSIYLLHFFIVFRIANAINKNLIDLSNIYIAMVFSLLSFLIMIPIGYFSYRFIESPFLMFRTKYLKSDQ